MEKQEIRILERIQKILGVSLLTILGSVMVNYCWETYKTNQSIEHINEIVAGEDRVIDSKESYLVLKALQYPNLEHNNPITSDKERVYFYASVGPIGKLVGVYIGTEPFRWRYSDCRQIGSIYRSALEDAIKKEFKK